MTICMNFEAFREECVHMWQWWCDDVWQRQECIVRQGMDTWFKCTIGFLFVQIALNGNSYLHTPRYETISDVLVRIAYYVWFLFHKFMLFLA